jgi:hypothetical protein
MKRISPHTFYRANDQHHADWKPARIEPKSSAVIMSLPYGVKLYRIGLDLPLDLPMPRWEALGVPLANIGSGIQFGLGDWWTYGDHNYAARRAAVKAAAQSIPYDYDSLMNLGYVARQVHISLRNENLSFSHHVAVAPLAPSRQAKYLDMAARRAWTVQQLRRHVGLSKQRDKRDEPLEWRIGGYLSELLREAETGRHFPLLGVAPWEDPRLDHADQGEVERIIAAVDKTRDSWEEYARGLKSYRDRRLAEGDVFNPRALGVKAE